MQPLTTKQVLNFLIAFVIGYQLMCTLPDQPERVKTLSKQKWFIYATLFLMAYKECQSTLAAAGITGGLVYYFL